MGSAPFAIGRRVRHYRRKNGNRSQAAVAGLCGISERYLQQIEAGQKVPSADVLARLAAELGVPLASLLSEDHVDSDLPPDGAEAEVVRALMGCGPRPSGVEPPTPAQLRTRLEHAWRIWQSSKWRFSEAAETLPSLVVDVERARRSGGDDAKARREVLQVAADMYGLLRSYCRRTGRLDLSLMAADRALRAAEEADDPVRVSAAKWNLGHVLLSHRDADSVEEAKEVALLAIEQLRRRPSTVELQARAVEGALELVAAVSDARCGRWWHARQRLEQRAAPLAKQVGERNVQWTVFGPANVHMHALSIEMLAGEAAKGLALADQIDTSRVPSRERRFTFTLEVARCHDLRRDDAAVLLHLLNLEDLAPEDLKRSALARELVGSLQRRVRPTFRRQVSELAERLQFV
ncbi:helix-turn-helix domain-containing protein [Rhizomonospora bruguierae]|uniref:helix-turn-helix domain-containing protein n=1 Tax=Rhizomonospora bruguierae TaxID=1581705 RepID=UPI001BD0F4F9|nr:helix-turn-helix transcriptional regulator [Micromonospora sp. NBRC 107566]